MPTRIYAFAKELGLDNKALLEICEKASIKGKGSALASLDDTEMALIKSFMDGDSAVTETAAPQPEAGAPIRPRTSVKKKIGEIETPVREDVVDESETVETSETGSADTGPAEAGTASEEASPEVSPEADVSAEASDSPVESEVPSQPVPGGGGLHSRLNSGESESPATNEGGGAQRDRKGLSLPGRPCRTCRKDRRP